MDKNILRNNLFEKYFEDDNGILAVDLVDKLLFIPETWEHLHLLCEKKIKYFDAWSELERFTIIEYNNCRYLIIKLGFCKYVIIDLLKNENITFDEFKRDFSEEFFINHFNEIKSDEYKLFPDFYSIRHYNGDTEELLSLYEENREIFELSSQLYYKYEIGNAFTYFFIDFVNASAQMGFQTPDQFLYEQLFLRYNLEPSRMQDAQSKMGIETMNLMFERIKQIRIPKKFIPSDLYEQYELRIKEAELSKKKSII